MRVNLSWDTGLLLLSTMLAATPALARPWKSATAAADRPVVLAATANTTRAYATEYWSPLTAEVSGVEAIQLLVRRQLPRRLHHAFEFILDASLGGNASDFDSFKVTKDGSKIRITGATTPALSRGLLTYLRKIGGDITWSGSTFKDLLYGQLIDPENVEGASWGQYRYFMNIVTFSYTNFGLSESEIYDWFSGPAFESWQRMGNMRVASKFYFESNTDLKFSHGSWGLSGQNSTDRPVSSEWIDKQWILQKQIIARMVALGMTPVLPAFNGFAPAALNEIVGRPSFLNASNWEGFPETFTDDTAIDPTWPSFSTVQSAFLKKQAALYGGWTSTFYSIDLFNELKPYSLEPAYLKNNTASVVASLREVDPKATWVMQGWLFVSDTVSWNATTIPALLSGATSDEMIILDLASEAIPAWNKTSSFGGKRWVWNLLHDYGQNQGLYGSLDHYTTEIIRARGNSSSLIGSGITMEGMNQNELVYELTLDSAWSSSAINVTSWLHDFVQRRYGLCHTAEAAGATQAHAAWALLAGSTYNNTNFSVQGVVKSPLELVPAVTGIANKTGHHPTLLTYDPKAVVAALDLLLEAATASPTLLQVAGFQMDLVDVARQAFINLGIPLYENLLATWNSTTVAEGAVLIAGAKITDLLADIDAVLATNDYFLLSKWIGEAKSWSADVDEVAFLEYQARNQLTLWGTASTVPWPLSRYASKQWAGVVSEYYLPGWDQFARYLATVTPFQYNATTFQTSLLSFEKAWQLEVWGTEDSQTWGTKGTSFDVIVAVRGKWAATIKEVYP